MKKIAVIPARGGSKRIPKKNIRLFCDQPIISYSIKNAFESGVFDEVIVSTDDEEIAEISKTYGAKIPFLRPKELSLDTTPTLPVIAHAIKELHLNFDDLVCCIYPTAPLLKSQYLTSSLDKLLQSPEKLYIFSCVEFDFTPWRAFLINNENEEISMLFEKHSLSRSQDLKKVYHDAGAFYWGKTGAFCDEKPIFHPHSIPFILPRMFVQDIDTLDDWEIAQIKYKLKNSK
ncbi:pseudaminic acid cytidylyltransferase [Helicobacter cappadocius]|uniref:Pseudaminic acid cytidylyltransferase n=1 Tax=Helicobacter cappadocius TaxID=3063998 RepID=A0AA90TBW4_9HELI|nr:MULTISPECIES: pseudaminic acid cytidylyltransferase [unclassified Helicobacter]MDO7253359.1 pseudaminic acid cytidylyltransferase [Helicobacter sp. faydin-H75]MDP2539211.1 pseudaminic acid cytidylyltransferase [Helicobacter sp. faydin-H76]